MQWSAQFNLGRLQIFINEKCPFEQSSWKIESYLYAKARTAFWKVKNTLT